MTGGDWWDAPTRADIVPLLWHRRWWRHRLPFPHVHAVNVLRPEVYLELEHAFRAWLDSCGGGTELDGHDLQGTTVTAAFRGPLRLFASTGWLELLRSALDVSVTRYVNVGLHHHRAGSAPGFAHTDLNPGWFPDDGGDGIVLTDPDRVEYPTGARLQAGVRAVRVIRAVAVLFYLANPPWQPEHDNCTGLYRARGDDMAEPVRSIAPHSNSLLAFECTPWSFHGFTGGGDVARNSVVQWLHRTPAAVRARWGPGVVVGYGGIPE
jgi:2OG-Fe(II) oxygenase superfamily